MPVKANASLRGYTGTRAPFRSAPQSETHANDLEYVNLRYFPPFVGVVFIEQLIQHFE